jgi:membrane protein DedA with SNARE-associated domain
VHDLFVRLVQEYGYWAVALGSLAEGETIVALGGVFAQKGLLSLPIVMIIAFIGSFVGDQILFQVGKAHGPWVLRRWPRLNAPAERAFRLLQRYQTLFIIGFRFVYGIRTVSALAIGASGVSTARFLVLNAVAAALWATTISWVGYSFAHALDYALGQAQEIEIGLLGLLVFALLIGLVARLRRKPANKA